MKKIVFSFAMLLLVASITACTPGNRGKSSGGGTNTGSENLSQQVARHDQQIQMILGQIGQVEQVLPGQAEMWSQVQTMRQELNTVHGQVEELNNQLSSSGTGEVARLNERLSRLETLTNRIAAQLGIDASDLTAPSAIPTETSPHEGITPPVSDPDEDNTPTVSAPPAASGGKDTPQLLYDKGIKAFDQKNYKNAIVAFKDFTTNYPKHKLTANAYFWQGQCYYEMKDYARAALAYHEVITKFPSSNKLQSSMLKQGMAFYHAGKASAGKGRLEELIKKYPSSPEASSAKNFLKKNP